MLLLAIDTSAAYVSVALLTSEQTVCYDHQTMERGQGEALIGAIERLFAATSYRLSDLTGVAVAVGPGSFTGVRVGLACARGLALALNIPVVGVDNFEAWAYGLGQAAHVVLDTKRGDYYVQSFDASGAPVDEAGVFSADFLRQKLPFTAVGDGARLLQNEIGCAVLENLSPAAVNVGRIALSRMNRPRAADPFYLREADVTVSK